ncbi:hypothetical protein A9Q91_03635 [Candidatus Gracilibacteria bacterium 28_42_T64]|nr:hypothetical protein A9Q91_03635 [Candidatus Gracilibacteria bacterium 28_42_T64]
MYKKIISLVVVSLSVAAVSASYNDMIEAANNLASDGIINDHSDNTSLYNLDDNVLRQEIAAVARGVAGLSKKSSCDNIFTDLSATNPNSWACVNVEVLVDNNLISKNTTFRPEDKITKAETIGMLIKAIGFDYSYNTASSKGWQEQIVDFAVAKGVIDRFYDYNSDATRGWVFEVADTTIKKDKEIKKMKEEGTYSDETL